MNTETMKDRDRMHKFMRAVNENIAKACIDLPFNEAGMLFGPRKQYDEIKNALREAGLTERMKQVKTMLTSLHIDLMGFMIEMYGDPYGDDSEDE